MKPRKENERMMYGASKLWGGKNDLHSLRKETIGEGYIIFYFGNNVRMYVFFGGCWANQRGPSPQKRKKNHFGS
jgi:hypothetical protein